MNTSSLIDKSLIIILVVSSFLLLYKCKKVKEGFSLEKRQLNLYNGIPMRGDFDDMDYITPTFIKTD